MWLIVNRYLLWLTEKSGFFLLLRLAADNALAKLTVDEVAPFTVRRRRSEGRCSRRVGARYRFFVVMSFSHF
ncbi:MAG: hypothetical protein HC903_32405 [Methylacidiphilales bacterium]|nr:hypothetical protein [Candidatus Methylacidiphilales bacterium]NJR19691.1 hypothetical protein [Calothrix sp. CSU_2_0]